MSRYGHPRLRADYAACRARRAEHRPAAGLPPRYERRRRPPAPRRPALAAAVLERWGEGGADGMLPFYELEADRVILAFDYS